MDPLDTIKASIEYATRKSDERMHLLYGDDAEAVVAEMRAKQAEWKKRHESYMGRLRWFATRLDAAVDCDPVARAVCDLHQIEEVGDELQCTECEQYEGNGQPWPCDTVKAVAEVLNVEVPTE